MKKNGKELVCPNCFGTDRRESLTTAISRNIVEDEAIPEGEFFRSERRKDIVRMFCVHCGHELHRQGNRA